jgi:hypothetical protein
LLMLPPSVTVCHLHNLLCKYISFFFFAEKCCYPSIKSYTSRNQSQKGWRLHLDPCVCRCHSCTFSSWNRCCEYCYIFGYIVFIVVVAFVSRLLFFNSILYVFLLFYCLFIVANIYSTTITDSNSCSVAYTSFHLFQANKTIRNLNFSQNQQLFRISGVLPFFDALKVPPLFGLCCGLLDPCLIHFYVILWSLLVCCILEAIFVVHFHSCWHLTSVSVE